MKAKLPSRSLHFPSLSVTFFANTKLHGDIVEAVERLTCDTDEKVVVLSHFVHLKRRREIELGGKSK